MKPLTYKLYFQEDDDDDLLNGDEYSDKYWDSGLGAAGCIFIAKDTGRILLAHRSNRVNEPHTWGTWGGKIDEGESPKQAVVREIEEETGYDGRYQLSHLWTFEDPEEGFQYHNYVVLVPFEFTPRLNWEADNSKWVEWCEWPSPLHFGLQAFLKNAGQTIYRIIKLIRRKKSDILEAMDSLPPSPPSIVQKAEIKSPAVMNLTHAYIVAATVWGEAADQGEEGMHAVMNVIMNRSKGEFANAVKVVLALNQFSMWNGVTNPEAQALKDANVWRRDKNFQKCFQIVDRAFQGKLPDITGGALFYFNPDKAAPSWAKKLVYTKTIGDHQFYKLPPKKDKKKVPAAIREMIENQNPSDAVIFKGPLIGDGIWKYEFRSPFSVIKYRFAPKQKLFYLDSIATPNVQNQGKGYASGILETFFNLIKQHNGTLDCDTYSVSGMEKIKPLIERMAKQFGVRLVQGADDLMESDNSSNFKRWFRNSKVVNKDGTPLEVFKGSRWESNGKPFTHIDRGDPLPSFHGNEPGVKVAGFFSSDPNVAQKFAFGSEGYVKSFYLRIENPYVLDMKKDFSATNQFAAYAQFGPTGKRFRDAMRDDKYDGAIILNTRDEGNVFIIKDPHQAKLVSSGFNPDDKNFTTELCVDNSAKSGMMEAEMGSRYGDPGHHVVWGGLWSTGRIAEGERLDYLSHQIAALEAEWERLDSQGNRSVQQQEIQKQLAKLRREKGHWDSIYQAVNGLNT